LEKLKKKTNFTCTVNTFGFGYELDSKLLEDISILGNSGTYAFIPDGSFVGTIFVNAITSLLTTVATNVQVMMSIETEPVYSLVNCFSLHRCKMKNIYIVFSYKKFEELRE
jgi:hypothetical protein